MTTLSLNEAPAALPVESRATWLSAPASDLKVGDLWLLSWNREALAMVVITKIIDDYVLACPVTLPTDPAFAPAVIRDDTPLGVPLTIWPGAETGLGTHLLHRNLGSLLSERTVSLLRRYAEDGTESPLPVAEGDYYADGNPEFLRALLGHMQSLCFHEWPTDAVEDAVLSPQVIRERNANVSFMSNTLGVTVPRARQLLRGETTPSPSEIALLSEAWSLAPEVFLVSPSGDAASTLTQPLFKPLLADVMEAQGIDEVTARRRAQHQYALAARAAQTGDRNARMRAAIDRVRRGDDGTS